MDENQAAAAQAAQKSSGAGGTQGMVQRRRGPESGRTGHKTKNDRGRDIDPRTSGLAGTHQFHRLQAKG